jgi:hypothetical protein
MINLLLSKTCRQLGGPESSRSAGKEKRARFYTERYKTRRDEDGGKNREKSTGK